MKQLYCEQCRQHIAGFDELKKPLTFDQFVDWHPEGTLPLKFGGEKKSWETFTCTRCGRWPFVDGQTDPLNRAHPSRVRTGYNNDKKDWYVIPGYTEPKKKFQCPHCPFSTDYDSSLKRHIASQHG